MRPKELSRSNVRAPPVEVASARTVAVSGAGGRDDHDDGDDDMIDLD